MERHTGRNLDNTNDQVTGLFSLLPANQHTTTNTHSNIAHDFFGTQNPRHNKKGKKSTARLLLWETILLHKIHEQDLSSRKKAHTIFFIRTRASTMLEMEMEPTRESSTTMTTATNSNNEARTRRVKFLPYASQITVPTSKDDAPSLRCLWYSKEEMFKLARADVNALIAQSKGESSSDVVVCGRGLEMHMPGQLASRQKRRNAYTAAILQKQALLSTLYGDDKIEFAERLRKFAEQKSKQYKEEAHALGVQDALDVRKEASIDHGTSKDVAIRPKQMLSPMRNQPILRAA